MCERAPVCVYVCACASSRWSSAEPSELERAELYLFCWATREFGIGHFANVLKQPLCSALGLCDICIPGSLSDRDNPNRERRKPRLIMPMQQLLNTVSRRVLASDDAAQSGATVSTITPEARAHAEKLAAEATASAQAKLAKAADNRKPKPAPAKQPASPNGKAAAKRVASKPAAKPQPAKPTAEAREAAQRAEADSRRLARQCAAQAVGEFYAGASKPFKAASDRFADINPSNGKSATPRQAALALALITHGSGNMRRDGTFTRGAFVVPARLVNPSAKPGDTIRAQPESGCLGNMLGRICDYVSGPRSGREQSAAVYRLRVDPAIAEIQAAFGDKPAQAARKLLSSFAA
jgi:hypothetical protein